MIYRKAKFDDVEPIYQLVRDYAAQGDMLPRSGRLPSRRRFMTVDFSA